MRFANDSWVVQKGFFGEYLALGRVAGLAYPALLVGDYQGSPNGDDSAGQLFVCDPVIHAKVLRVYGNKADRFGTRIRSGVDLDGDGFDEVLVGAMNAEVSRNRRYGQVYLFDGASMTKRFTFDGASSGEGFDGPSDFLSDLDGDGIRDLLLAAPLHDTATDFNAGRVQIASGRDGTILWTGTGSGFADAYGDLARNLFDMDGDGLSEYAWLDKSFTRLNIWSGLPPTLVRTLDLSNNVGLPEALEVLPDLDGDGAPELAIGGLQPRAGGTPGQVVIFSTRTWRPLTVIRGEDPHTYFFGYSISIPGDLTGDGRPEIVVVDHGIGSLGPGSLALFQMPSLRAAPDAPQDTTSGGVATLTLTAPAHPAGEFILLLSESAATGFPYVTRTVPLDATALLYWSVEHPLYGWLDGAGNATVKVSIPSSERFSGHDLFACWLGLDASSPWGVRLISNELRIQIP
jgi:hypothetical protein